MRNPARVPRGWIPALAVVLAVAPAAAEDDVAMGFGEDPPDEPAESMDEDEAFLKGELTEEEAALTAPEVDPDTLLAEEPGRAYYSVGGRFRWIVIPDWFMFGADVKARDSTALLISNLAGGAEFTYRKDGFDITAAVWYVGLGWQGDVSFKGRNEDINSWEVVTNDIRAILLTVDFIWSTSITDWFAITYGAGLGLGIPWGDIIRTEATAASGGFERCRGPNIPAGDAGCPADGQYEEVYDIPTGIVPWVNLLLGMRFKVHRHVALYADMGFGLGFQSGVRAAYIF